MKRLLFLGQILMILTALHACRARPSTSLPKDIAIVTREQWGAAKPTMPVYKHIPVRITIHHTGVKQNPAHSINEKLKSLQKYSVEHSTMANGKVKKVWADIPYHFYIAADGQIGEGRQLKYVGESNTPYDPTDHALIVLEGNFEKEEVSKEQYQSLQKLVLALAKRYRVPAENISGHQDHAETICPGKNLYALIPQLQRSVQEAALKK